MVTVLYSLFIIFSWFCFCSSLRCSSFWERAASFHFLRAFLCCKSFFCWCWIIWPPSHDLNKVFQSIEQFLQCFSHFPEYNLRNDVHQNPQRWAVSQMLRVVSQAPELAPWKKTLITQTILRLTLTDASEIVPLCSCYRMWLMYCMFRTVYSCL